MKYILLTLTISLPVYGMLHHGHDRDCSETQPVCNMNHSSDDLISREIAVQFGISESQVAEATKYLPIERRENEDIARAVLTHYVNRDDFEQLETIVMNALDQNREQIDDAHYLSVQSVIRNQIDLLHSDISEERRRLKTEFIERPFGSALMKIACFLSLGPIGVIWSPSLCTVINQSTPQDASIDELPIWIGYALGGMFITGAFLCTSICMVSANDCYKESTLSKRLEKLNDLSEKLKTE